MFNVSQKLGNYGLYLTDCISNIDEILEVVESLNEEKTRIGSYVAIDKNESLIHIWNSIDLAMKKALLTYTQHFNKNINDYHVSGESYHITKWDVGSDIGFHVDSWEEFGKTRTPAISILAYLTDNFTGGELVFPKKIYEVSDSDLIIRPEAGSIAIFESNTLHRVNTLLSGTRITTNINYMK